MVMVVVKREKFDMQRDSVGDCYVERSNHELAEKEMTAGTCVEKTMKEYGKSEIRKPY
jgi:hypothetical protein